MGDIKLFKMSTDGVEELLCRSVSLERSLQNLIEKHLEGLFGIRFLATEYSTGRVHGGRIDTLGIDENGCPVIIEYKRTTNEAVINQGLYYLDWLMDHRGEFELLVQKKQGKESAEGIEWTSPRLICIAGDFTKYDEYAVKQIDRNIELIRYRKYGDDFLLFELVNATAATYVNVGNDEVTMGNKQTVKTVEEYLEMADTEHKDRYELLKSFMVGLGDDVQIKALKHYIAFKRIKNFACVEIHPLNKSIIVYVKADLGSITLENGFTRDVSKIGHLGTGNLEITIIHEEDLKKAEPLILQSYEAS